MNEFKSASSVNNVKELPAKKEDQFHYLGRWVAKKGFRAFLYGAKDQQKLANSYEEYKALTESGLWFASKEEVKDLEIVTPILKGVKKHGADSR